ncbi:mCG148226 [Mus musculus]|nr:mCG148226 [Mus musculus]
MPLPNGIKKKNKHQEKNSLTFPKRSLWSLSEAEFSLLDWGMSSGFT